MEGGDLTEDGLIYKFDDELSEMEGGDITEDGFIYAFDSGCRVCGCSREFDNLGDRVCYCDLCWSGCRSTEYYEAAAVASVKDWMVFLLGAAKSMTAEARAIVLVNEKPEASILDEHKFFSAGDGLATPALYSTLSYFSWMVPSNELYLCDHEDCSSEGFICVALSPFIALELRTSRLHTIRKEHNAQPLDIIIVGAECEPAGRLKLLVDGKLDKLVYTAPGSLDVRSIVLPPAVMLRNYLPRLGNDVVQAILEFVGSPFVCDPPITVKTVDPLMLNYCNGWNSGNATYIVKYSKSSLGAQSMYVKSDLSSQSDYDEIGYVNVYKSTWRGNGRDAKVMKIHLSS